MFTRNPGGTSSARRWGGDVSFIAWLIGLAVMHSASGSPPSLAGSPSVAGRTATVCFDQPGDGSLWALGLTYKCQFTNRGLMYVPVFDTQAPRNYPLQLTLRSIDVDGNSMTLSAGQPARVGDRVVIDHGAVQEVYLLKPESVEQTFIFPQRPGAGEVKIQIAVESELTAADAGESLRFAGDIGSVGYTKAVTVDAQNRRAGVPTTFSPSGTIEITLPASLMAGAAYPLTVDPIITTFPVASTVGSTSERAPDVSYDATSNTYLIVWEHQVSATDGDVYSERYDATGAVVPGSFAAIDMSTANWRRPRVANNNIGNNHLVVGEVGAVGARQVFGRTRIASSNAMSAPFQISDSAAAGEQFSPDVGGDPFAGNPPSFFCVVWEQATSAANHDIVARLVDQGTSSPSGPVIVIDASLGTLDRTPAIAKSNTTAAVWSVVWEREVTPANGDIRGAQINFVGIVLVPSFGVDVTSIDARRPAVSSLTTFDNYMVVFEANPSTTADIEARVMNGAAVLETANLTLLEGVAASQPRVLPTVDATADRFVVACSQLVTPLNADVHVSTYCFTAGNLRIAEQHRSLDVSNQYADDVRLASVQGSGGSAASNDFLVAWANRGTPTTLGSIAGAIYRAHTTCCFTDIVINGRTDVDDLLAVITGWGPCANPSICPADANGDLVVNVDDLLAVISGWGVCQ